MSAQAYRYGLSPRRTRILWAAGFVVAFLVAAHFVVEAFREISEKERAKQEIANQIVWGPAECSFADLVDYSGYLTGSKLIVRCDGKEYEIKHRLHVDRWLANRGSITATITRGGNFKPKMRPLPKD